MERVAIITPTFNREPLLEDCVRSAVAQSHPDVSIYICDDNSTDGTDALMARLVSELPRVHYLKNRFSKGPQGPRITALEEGDEEFVAFLDSDNRYHEHAIARCIEVFRSDPAADVVCFGQKCLHLEPAGRKELAWIEDLIPNLEGNILRPLLRTEVAVDMGNCVIRRDALNRAGGLDETLPSYNDFELHIRLARFAKYRSIQEILMNYLIHGDQITANPLLRGRGLLQVANRHRALFEEAGAMGILMHRLLGHAKKAPGFSGCDLALRAFSMAPVACLQACRQ
jgi:glycosyltransferase involved in cell wall biosynthesis